MSNASTDAVKAAEFDFWNSAEAGETLARMISVIRDRTCDLAGGLRPEGELQMNLLTEVDRLRVLDDLLVKIAPRSVNVEIWQRWLEGGEAPFPKGALHTVKHGNLSSVQVLLRSEGRIKKQQEKIEQMEAALDAERNKLAYSQAYENAMLQWLVTRHITQLMSALIAVGPAFTVCRSISAFAGPEMIEEAISDLASYEKEEGAKEYVRNRNQEAETLSEGLDFFCGFRPFEDAVRKALLDVIEQFKGRREEAAAAGYRVRSKEVRGTTINPNGRQDAENYLDAIPKPTE